LDLKELFMPSSHHPSVSALLEALEQKQDGFRQFAMRRLLNIGPEAVGPLIQLLADRRPEIQESAAIVLATMGKPVIPDLIRAMKTSKDRKLCWGAAWVLATLGAEARAALPEVKIPVRNPAGPAEVPASNPGLWSDAWLTKVRAKLELARHEVCYFLAPFEPPIEPA
jgi:hypothetical protein